MTDRLRPTHFDTLAAPQPPPVEDATAQQSGSKPSSITLWGTKNVTAQLTIGIVSAIAVALLFGIVGLISFAIVFGIIYAIKRAA